MSRLFGRGELKAAIIDTLGEIEPANGYAIMQAMAEAIGGGWRPSPGAIYPAILGLEDAGLVQATSDDGGSVTYTLTADGSEDARRCQRHRVRGGRSRPHRAGGPVARLARRRLRVRPCPTDPASSARPSAAAVDRALESLHQRLTKILDKETNDG